MPATRIKEMEDRGELPLLPPIAHPYLVAWWMEIGPTTVTGMGEGPVTWQEIAKWRDLTGNDLYPWEAGAIRSMSQAFAAQRGEARKPDCPAPYRDAGKDAADAEERVTGQFKAMMAAFAKPKGRK